MKKSIFLVVLLSISSLLLAQRRTQPPLAPVAGPHVTQDQTAKDAPDTTTCSFIYTSGSGNNATSYCLTVNGNIVQFSRPNGFEYIAVGTFFEGYGICDLTAGSVAYSDYAASATPNWGATAVSFPNAATAKFVRTT